MSLSWSSQMALAKAPLSMVRARQHVLRDMVLLVVLAVRVLTRSPPCTVRFGKYTPMRYKDSTVRLFVNGRYLCGTPVYHIQTYITPINTCIGSLLLLLLLLLSPATAL